MPAELRPPPGYVQIICCRVAGHQQSTRHIRVYSMDTMDNYAEPKPGIGNVLSIRREPLHTYVSVLIRTEKTCGTTARCIELFMLAGGNGQTRGNAPRSTASNTNIWHALRSVCTDSRKLHANVSLGVRCDQSVGGCEKLVAVLVSPTHKSRLNTNPSSAG